VYAANIKRRSTAAWSSIRPISVSGGRSVKRLPKVPEPTKFDRWTDGDLINMIESEMRRTGELFRGMQHTRELDPEWVLAELETHTYTALLGIQTLRRRVALSQKI
jgi:hypothetical protein